MRAIPSCLGGFSLLLLSVAGLLAVTSGAKTEVMAALFPLGAMALRYALARRSGNPAVGAKASRDEAGQAGPVATLRPNFLQEADRAFWWLLLPAILLVARLGLTASSPHGDSLSLPRLGLLVALFVLAAGRGGGWGLLRWSVAAAVMLVPNGLQGWEGLRGMRVGLIPLLATFRIILLAELVRTGLTARDVRADRLLAAVGLGAVIALQHALPWAPIAVLGIATAELALAGALAQRRPASQPLPDGSGRWFSRGAFLSVAVIAGFLWAWVVAQLSPMGQKLHALGPVAVKSAQRYVQEARDFRLPDWTGPLSPLPQVPDPELPAGAGGRGPTGAPGKTTSNLAAPEGGEAQSRAARRQGSPQIDDATRGRPPRAGERQSELSGDSSQAAGTTAGLDQPVRSPGSASESLGPASLRSLRSFRSLEPPAPGAPTDTPTDPPGAPGAPGDSTAGSSNSAGLAGSPKSSGSSPSSDTAPAGISGGGSAAASGSSSSGGAIPEPASSSASSGTNSGSLANSAATALGASAGATGAPASAAASAGSAGTSGTSGISGAAGATGASGAAGATGANGSSGSSGPSKSSGSGGSAGSSGSSGFSTAGGSSGGSQDGRKSGSSSVGSAAGSTNSGSSGSGSSGSGSSASNASAAGSSASAGSVADVPSGRSAGAAASPGGTDSATPSGKVPGHSTGTRSLSSSESQNFTPPQAGMRTAAVPGTAGAAGTPRPLGPAGPPPGGAGSTGASGPTPTLSPSAAAGDSPGRVDAPSPVGSSGSAGPPTATSVTAVGTDNSAPSTATTAAPLASGRPADTAPPATAETPPPALPLPPPADALTSPALETKPPDSGLPAPAASRGDGEAANDPTRAFSNLTRLPGQWRLALAGVLAALLALAAAAFLRSRKRRPAAVSALGHRQAVADRKAAGRWLCEIEDLLGRGAASQFAAELNQLHRLGLGARYGMDITREQLTYLENEVRRLRPVIHASHKAAGILARSSR